MSLMAKLLESRLFLAQRRLEKAIKVLESAQWQATYAQKEVEQLTERLRAEVGEPPREPGAGT